MEKIPENEQKLPITQKSIQNTELLAMMEFLVKIDATKINLQVDHVKFDKEAEKMKK